MIELRLEHIGSGRFRPAGQLDGAAAEAHLGPGERVTARITKRRSVPQNALFHALIQAAYECQRGGPVLPSWEHLKSWLLIKAGHCEETRIQLGTMRQSEAAAVVGPMSAALRRRFNTVDVAYDQNAHEVVMRFAKSVAFAKTDADQMGEIMDRVIARICTEIVPGMDPETIMNEAKARAA